MSLSMLSKGALTLMLNGEFVDSPILQVLAYKHVPGSGGTSTRYRFILSDGEVTHQCCVVTNEELFPKIEHGLFERFTIIKLAKYAVTDVDAKKFLVINEPIPLKAGKDVGVRLGTPVSTKEPVAHGQAPLQQNTTANRQSINVSAPGKAEAPRTPGRQAVQPKPATTSPAINTANICPINALNPFQNRWTIRGACIGKSDIRTWNKPNNEGKLFSFDLEDETGGIRITGFNAECDKYFPMIEIGKTYVVARGNIKNANRKFTDYEYEMTLNLDSIVQLDASSGSSQIQFKNMTKISELEGKAADEKVDIAGVVRRVGDVQTIMSQKLNKELRKRDISLVDDSSVEVNLTLWGDDASNWAGGEGCVVVAKKAKISDYQGRQLSAYSIMIDPPSELVDELKFWYQGVKDSLSVRSISGTGQGGGPKNLQFLLQLLTDVQSSGKPLTANVRVRIVLVGKTNFYMACTNIKSDGKPCRKKVLDMNNGTYRCQSCDKDFESCPQRLFQSVLISDDTAEIWATLFHDEAEQVIGENASELFALKESDSEAFEMKIKSLSFRTFICRVRATRESYQDKVTTKVTIAAADEMNPPSPAKIEHGRQIVSLIKQLSETM